MRGTLATPVPRDVLERIARRSTALAMRSELTEAAQGYRDVVPPRKLRLVARTSSVLEDVLLELEGDRLRYEVRFPRVRREAVAMYGTAWALILVLIGGALVLHGSAALDLVVAAIGSGLVCALFTAVSLAMARSDARQELTRLLREATRRR